jgi:hypothetical protein
LSEAIALVVVVLGVHGGYIPVAILVVGGLVLVQRKRAVVAIPFFGSDWFINKRRRDKGVWKPQFKRRGV